MLRGYQAIILHRIPALYFHSNFIQIPLQLWASAMDKIVVSQRE